MARHPWVAEADNGIRWGLQTIIPADREALRRLLSTAQEMERLGFDSLFIMDHPAVHADPFIALSGVAAVTRKLWLGQLVMAATYRHPAYVARLQADLDNLSGGRSILGVGSGWFEAEYEMMNLPFLPIRERQEALDDMMAILDGVWSGEPFSYAGRQATVAGMMIDPAPALRPPVLVGGSGEKGTLRQVAQWGDACNLRESIPASDPAERDPERVAEVTRKFEVLGRHCDDLGRPRDEVLRTHFTSSLVMGRSQEEADGRADAVDTARSTSAGVRSRGRSFLFAAGPERAIAYFQALKSAGAQYFVIQVDLDDTVTMELLATVVMPAV
ncbi:MAG: LLM class flavin-dependent oxidoreductase [Thermomicrobiales bacterium]|nr:LLM class flavin-dependent oxidoreductase [Thermomicrobiales bacterium]